MGKRLSRPRLRLSPIARVINASIPCRAASPVIVMMPMGPRRSTSLRPVTICPMAWTIPTVPRHVSPAALTTDVTKPRRGWLLISIPKSPTPALGSSRGVTTSCDQFLFSTNGKCQWIARVGLNGPDHIFGRFRPLAVDGDDDIPGIKPAM